MSSSEVFNNTAFAKHPDSFIQQLRLVPPITFANKKLQLALPLPQQYAVETITVHIS